MIRDLRLLIPAAACWCAAWCAQQPPGQWIAGGRAPACWIGLAMLLAAACLLLPRLGPRTWRNRPRTWINLAAVALLGAGAGAVAGGSHAAALDAEPLAGWAAHRLSAGVVGVVASPVTSRAVTSAAIWAPSTIHELRLDAEVVTVRGTAVGLRAPLLVRLDDPGHAPPLGARVSWHGRLFPADLRQQAAAVLRADAAYVELAPPGAVQSAASAMRSGLLRSLEGLPPDGAALTAGLAVGDESLQSPALADAMRASGLSHLTAVSGGNTAIVCAVVLFFAALLRVPLAARAWLAAASLAFYVVLVGPQPSVLRAAVMGGVMLIAVVVGGRGAGSAALAASVLVLVILAPGLAVSWGFALSVFATCGLLLLSGPIERALARLPVLRSLPAGALAALAVTLAAQASTLPVLVLMGSAVGWVSIPANLLAAPAVAPVTVLGLAAAVVAPFSPANAALLGHLAVVPAEWIARVAFTTSGWPYGALPWPQGGAGLALLAVAALAVVIVRLLVAVAWPAGLTLRQRRGAALATAVLLLAGWAVRAHASGWPPPGWLLLACDVGQGDALLLRTGPRAAAVIDVGPDPAAVRDCLRDSGIAEVSAVVLTHFHADHVAGLRGVLESWAVPVLLVGPLADPREEHDRTLELAAENAVPVEVVRPGEIRRVGEAEWRTLWPRRIIMSGSAPNNASIVLLVTVEGRQLLLCGDIEPEAQAAISADLRGLHLTAIKIPHHGSRFQHPLLPVWAPAPIALISVGAHNDYGHPAASTVRAWQDAGAIVGRTDLDGALAVALVGSEAVLVARGR